MSLPPLNPARCSVWSQRLYSNEGTHRPPSPLPTATALHILNKHSGTDINSDEGDTEISASSTRLLIVAGVTPGRRPS